MARIITVKPGIIGCGGSYNFIIESYNFVRARNNFIIESYNFVRAINNPIIESYNFVRERNNFIIASYNFTDGYYINQVGYYNNLLCTCKCQTANCFVLWACCTKHGLYIHLNVCRNVDYSGEWCVQHVVSGNTGCV